MANAQRSVYNASCELPRYRGKYVVLTRRPSLVFKPPPPVKFFATLINFFFLLSLSRLYMGDLTKTPGALAEV